MNSKSTLLCFVSHYLPGYRSGGPVRTISNFVDQLGDEFNIRIVTRDRDMFDTEPYPNIEIDAWNTNGKAQVFYASKKTVNLQNIAKLIRETPHDVLYLNSFFNFGFTTLPLLARRLGWAAPTPCVIAPRGEFSSGALALKATKKCVFMHLVKVLGLFQNLHWQASSVFEKDDIILKIGSIAQRVHVSPNLTTHCTKETQVALNRKPGPLRLIFLSRISPKKNLDFLLRVLAKVNDKVELAIFGPEEKPLYWQQCMKLIDLLPENIHVIIGGPVPQQQVSDVFANYDVFLFPTRGENFGHVVFESLTVGTSVLVSDQTPWHHDVKGGLKVIPLEETLWVDAIEALVKLDSEALINKRQAAVDYANDFAANNHSLQLNRKLFHTVAIVKN